MQQNHKLLIVDMKKTIFRQNDLHFNRHIASVSFMGQIQIAFLSGKILR